MPGEPISAGEVERSALMQAAMAHDAEDSAQRGEPSPWRDLTVSAEDVQFAEDRITCMRLAVAAYYAALHPPARQGEPSDG